MYRSFSVDITAEFFEEVIRSQGKEKIDFWKNLGKSEQFVKKECYDCAIQDLIDGKILDAQVIVDAIFPQKWCDVFISYSHEDEELVLTFAGFISDIFGLSVFVDSLYWGSADKLLKRVDDVYSKKQDGTYDYQKRNLTTSHVHAMLTTAIMHIMDSSEVILFLNTKNSVPLLKETISGIKQYTLSPWIYEELVMSNLLRERDWTYYRKKINHDSFQFEKELSIAYNIPLSSHQLISVDVMKDWIEKYNLVQSLKKNKQIRTIEEFALHYEGYDKVNHPLNILYKLMEVEAKS